MSSQPTGTRNRQDLFTPNINSTSYSRNNRDDLFSSNTSRKDIFSPDNQGSHDLRPPSHFKSPSTSFSARNKRETFASSLPYTPDIYQHNPTANQSDMHIPAIDLEHVIGYTGHNKSTLHYDPNNGDNYITCMGSMVVIGKLSEAHSQEFLRVHDEEINALSVSSSGRLIASGQLKSTTNTGKGAPIIVWDYQTRTQLYYLQGFDCQITAISFSPDDHFLVAAGVDCRLIIWDMRTSEVVLTNSYPNPVVILDWGKMDEKCRRPKYTLAFAYSSQLIVSYLAYDIGSMQYKLDIIPCAMPSTGLIRDYTCGCMTHDRGTMLLGTIAGELVIFDVDNCLFKCTIPVSNNGILSVATCSHTGVVFAGSGDGTIKKLIGSQVDWSVAGQVQLIGRVISLSISPDGSELLAGTSSGKLYSFISDTLDVREIARSHVGSITACAFGHGSDSFASISSDGSIKVWDLCDYSIATLIQESVVGSSICFATDPNEGGMMNLIISGWKDGFIRAYDLATGMKKWHIANAHRGEVTSVATGAHFVENEDDVAPINTNEMYFVSGSSDGGVNVWSLATREMLLSFHEHKRSVTKVLVDVKLPFLIHSCGEDRGLFTYDIQRERRTTSHQVREGGFLSMSQRYDSETELVTGGSDGRILFWDCDIVDPVMELTDPNRSKLRSITISPSGRFLLTCGDDSLVKLYDLCSESLIATGIGHSDFIHCIHWSPDERQFISVGNDCCICVWNFYEGEE